MERLSLDRRRWLAAAAMGAVGALEASAAFGDGILRRPRSLIAFQAPEPAKQPPPAPSKFLIGCTTSPYRRFPLLRALQGIAGAGFQYVAWGEGHQENGGAERTPILAEDAEPTKAKELGQMCRDVKLTPILLHSLVAPEQKDAVKLLTQRILQAEAAGITQVATFGQTRGGNRPLWIERLKALSVVAKDHNVTLVIKPNGGETGSGKACAEIVKEVDHPNVMVHYDAGAVLDALNIDPIPDLRTCLGSIRSFAIRDHRKTPRNEDCGPGLGEIDHYKLLGQVSHTGREIALCCETLSAPLVAKPTKPEEVDALARRAREYLELVIAGLHAPVEAVG
jgi:sugar phosphate isomerase/epimerase